MKKTNIFQVTIIAVLAALFGSGGGIAWGQNYVTPNTVNNEFGAGESSFITGGIHGAQKVKSPWSINVFRYTKNGSTPVDPPLNSFGGTYENDLEASTPLDILLGNKTNTVIKTYTGDGFANGWVSIQVKYGTSDAPSVPYSPVDASKSFLAPINYNPSNSSQSNYVTVAAGDIIEFSFNKFNKYDFSLTNAGGSCQNPWHAAWDDCTTYGSINSCLSTGRYAPCGGPLFGSQVTSIAAGGSHIVVWHHYECRGGSVNVYPSDRPHGVYTSTISSKYTKTWQKGYFDDGGIVPIEYPIDDGVALVQFTGETMASSKSLVNQPLYKLKSDATAAHALGSINSSALTNPSYWGVTANTNNLEYLTNYRRPTSIVITGGTVGNPDYHQFDKFLYKDIDWEYEIDSVKANTTFAKYDFSSCNSGHYTMFGFEVKWEHDRRPGATLVDGAIALQPNAVVCVENDIKDATATPASEHPVALKATGTPNNQTDAVLVLTNQGRTTLRVGGSFDSINIVNDTAGFYTQASFPQHADTVYSYSATAGNVFNATGFQFGLNSLRGFNDGGKIKLCALLYHTDASVLGVRKNYNFKTNNAEWTTHLPNKATDHPGVIEIGDTTKGTGHMHIYSGGMLKNIDGCFMNSSFAMYLGHPAVGMGDKTSAQFNLNGNEPLYITNYGVGAPTAPCQADLLFYIAAADSLAAAFKNATGDGIMRIQAYNDLEMRATTTIDATAAGPGRGNDFYMLSDAGNVVTQKFNFKSDFQSLPTRRGMLGIWAEDRDDAVFASTNCKNTGGGAGNRNSLRGNVYMNAQLPQQMGQRRIFGLQTISELPNSILSATVQRMIPPMLSLARVIFISDMVRKLLYTMMQQVSQGIQLWMSTRTSLITR